MPTAMEHYVVQTDLTPRLIRPIAVAIPVCNEEALIPACIEALVCEIRQTERHTTERQDILCCSNGTRQFL